MPFDPLHSSESFRISVPDYTAFCVFPTLMAEAEKMAPHIQFELCHLPNNPALNELLAGEVDLALGFSEPDDLRHQDLDEVELFNDEFMVIANRRRTTLTLDDYLAAGHLVVTPWNEKKGLLDTHLAHLGLERRIVLKTPSMLSSPHIIAESDLLMAIPTYVAGKITAMAQVKSFKLPFYAPRFTVKIFSHKRSGKKPSTEWLKGVVASSIAAKINPTTSAE